MKTVTLYSKSGCHLCEQAYLQIDALKKCVAFTLDVVDIRSDQELYAQFREVIPAVRVGARLFEEGPFSEDILDQITREVET